MKTILMIIAFFLTSQTAFSLSRQDARVAKERMSRCQYNDSVCVGHVLIDAMVASGENGSRPPIQNQEKAITVHQQNQCMGEILKTVVLKKGQLQQAIDQCESGNQIHYSNSYAIDGICVEKSNMGPTRSLCTKAVIRANSDFN